jgi:Fe2+ or Zn2+ uptake regulation protein
VVCKLFAIVPLLSLAEVDRIRALLVRAGHAWTRPRAAVLQVLVAASVPLKVEEIHARLGRRGASRAVNLSSVYRTVNLLRGLGIARPVRFADGAQRFELAEDYREHHHHFVCERCGRVEDVRPCPVAGVDLQRWAPAVTSHHLELFGLCPRCVPTEPRDVRA